MIKELKKYIGTDTLISIYNDEFDNELFYLGFIVDADDYVLINAIDTRGLEDGFKLIKSSDVFLLQNDIMYSEKMMKLFKLKNQKRETIDVMENDTLLSLLKKAKEENWLVKINDNVNYIGYVKKIKKDLLIIDIMTEYGSKIGLSYIDTKKIDFIECKNFKLRDLELLYGKNNITVVK